MESFGNPWTFFNGFMRNSWAVVVHDPRSLLLLYPPQTLGAYWFVQTILLVYLFYPFLERIALGPQQEQPASSSRLVIVGVVCCALKFGMGLWLAIDVDAVYGTSIFHVWKSISLYALPLLKIPDFMLGVLVPHFGVVSSKSENEASSEKSEQGSAWKAWLPYVSDFVFVLIIFYGYVCPKSHRSVLLWDVNTQAPFWAFVMWGLCFGPQPSILGRIFSSPTLVALGEWGYGMYLYHPPLLAKFGRWPYLLIDISMLDGYYPNTHWFGGFSEMEYKHWGLLMVIPVSLLMSWSTFVLVEVPHGEWARKVIGKRSSAAPSLPPGNLKPLQEVRSGG
jgi:peptidoglycan/LPS O-acetylase OafA/YrhL